LELGAAVASRNEKRRERTMRTRIVTTAVACLTAIALLVPAGVANAGGVEKVKHGQCDPKGRWELSVDKEAGRIEVDLEITSAPAGQRWKVVMRHNDAKIFDGMKVTRRDDDDKPDLEVERHVDDRPGIDRFRVRARNTVTGAVCRAAIWI
jgi:hypothetical protein